MNPPSPTRLSTSPTDYFMPHSTEIEDEKNNRTSEVSAVEPSTDQNSITTGGESPRTIQNSQNSQLAQEKVMVLSEIVSFANSGLKTEDHEKLKQILNIFYKLLKSNKLSREEQEIAYESLVTIINHKSTNKPNLLYRYLYNYVQNEPLTDILDVITFHIISINPTSTLKTVNLQLISLKSPLIYENIRSYMRSILKYNEERKLLNKEIQNICKDLHTIRVNLVGEKDEDNEIISKEINSVMTSLMSSLSSTEHIAYHADLVKSETLDPKSVAHMRLKAQSTRNRFYGISSCVCYLMRPSSVIGCFAIEYITPHSNLNTPEATFLCRQNNSIWEWYKGNELWDTYNSLDDLLKATPFREATIYPVPNPGLF